MDNVNVNAIAQETLVILGEIKDQLARIANTLERPDDKDCYERDDPRFDGPGKGEYPYD